jgi:4-amino-4-deoxy-L-arabinose transferase-like glycosyltransferase
VPVAFVLLAILALMLRVWGLDFGRDQPRARPDEELFLGPALHMFGDSLNPGLLGYGFPEGYFLLLHGALRVYARVLAWWYGQEVNLGCLFALAPTRVLLVGRWLSATMGTLTVVPTALLARRLVGPAGGTRAALLGALLLAVNYLHGRDSHFAVTDATLTLAVAWAAWAIVRTAEDGRPAHALLAAACSGLAVAVKWTALFLLPVLGLALAVMVWGGKGSVARRSGVALLALATLALGFVTLCPHVPGALAETWSGLVSHQMRYDPKEAGRFLLDPSVDPGIGLVFHSRVTLPIAFGWPGIVAALVGIAYGLRRRPRAAWPCVLVLVFVYGAAVGPTRLLFVRYCLPVVPVLAALAAAGRARSRGGRTRARRARLGRGTGGAARGRRAATGGASRPRRHAARARGHA